MKEHSNLGKSLEIARESRGYTQGDLAKLTNISQAQISKYETGEKQISATDLELFSKILEYPESYFKKDRSNNVIHLDFRKGKSVPKKTFRRIHSIVNRTRSELKDILKEVELDLLNIPENIHSNQPEIVAEEIRRFWKIPSGPIHNLIKIIEDRNILLLGMKFSNEDKFSACAIEIDFRQPLIIFNSFHPMDRIRFSISHELGHILLHHNEEADFSIPYEFDLKIKETEANKFASCFLMPKNDIINDLKSISLDKLQNLKFKWRVSIAALLQRAFDLETISYEKYISFRKELSARRWIIKEPGDIPVETPSLIKEIFSVYIEDYGYTEKELSDLLGLHLYEFNSIYMNKGLRLLNRGNNMNDGK